MREKHRTNNGVEKFEHLKKGKKNSILQRQANIALQMPFKSERSCSGKPTLACSGHSSQRDPAAAGQHWLAAARWVFPEIKELFTYRAAAGQQWLAAAAFDGFELICIFHQFLYGI